MNLGDALSALGLSLPTDADAARRAYMRLLKKHKPEVDPQGFMRLREAYEEVRAALSAPSIAEVAPPPAPSPEPPPPPSTSPSTSPSPAAPAERPPAPPAPPAPVYDLDDEADVEAYFELGAAEDAADIVIGAFLLAKARGVFDGLPVLPVTAAFAGSHRKAVAFADLLDLRAPLFAEELGDPLRQPPASKWSASALLVLPVALLIVGAIECWPDAGRGALLRDARSLRVRASSAGLPLGPALTALTGHIEQGRCDLAVPRARDLVDALSRWEATNDVDPGLDRSLRELTTRVTRWCGERSPGPPSRPPEPPPPMLPPRLR